MSLFREKLLWLLFGQLLENLGYFYIQHLGTLNIQLPIFRFFKYGPNPASFWIFSFFSQCKDKYSTNLTKNEKRLAGVFGLRTQGSRMVDADESTEMNFTFLVKNKLQNKASSPKLQSRT